MGDSLFLWRLGFAFVCFLISAVIWGPLFLFSGSLFFWDWNLDLYPLYGLFGISFLALMIGVAIAYVWLFLEHFVVPIMYLHGLSASKAWRRFLPLFRANWVDFMLYGVVVLIALLMFSALIVAVGFATCCLGWLVLAIPYLSSVLLLPLSVPFRLYGVEFLAQFGPDLKLPGSGGAAPEPPPAASAAGAQ